MPIEIRCPNGHKLICPDEFTGANVKCPRCGELTEISARALSRSGVIRGAGADVGEGASDSQIGLEQTPDSNESITVKQGHSPIATAQIAFNCPNGHRLKGPISLQGRLGECPHCQARFRIPAFDDPPVPELSEPDLYVESDSNTLDSPQPPPLPAEKLAVSSERLPVFSPPVDVDDEEKAEKTEVTGDPVSPVRVHTVDAVQQVDILPSYSRWAEDPRSESCCHPLSRLFETLWEEREHGGVVELHLSSGDVLTPEHWSPSLSGAGYAVFAQEMSDGTCQIDAVAWDEIQRVSVQRITELPGAHFG